MAFSAEIRSLIVISCPGADRCCVASTSRCGAQRIANTNSAPPTSKHSETRPTLRTSHIGAFRSDCPRASPIHLFADISNGPRFPTHPLNVAPLSRKSTPPKQALEANASHQYPQCWRTSTVHGSLLWRQLTGTRAGGRACPRGLDSTPRPPSWSAPWTSLDRRTCDGLSEDFRHSVPIIMAKAADAFGRWVVTGRHLLAAWHGWPAS